MAKEITRAQTMDIGVGWAQDSQYVTIAVQMHKPTTSEQPATILEWLSRWAPEIAKQETALAAGLTDRASVNKLIRDLKRARDVAFGKDE